MNSCELATFVSATACSISNCVTEKELELLAAVFSQLGDTITTILTHRGLCNNDDDKNQTAVNE